MLLESILSCLAAAQPTAIHGEFIKAVGDQRGTDTALGSKYSAPDNHSNFSTNAETSPMNPHLAMAPPRLIPTKLNPLPNTAAGVCSEILAGAPTQQPGVQWLCMDG